MSKPLEDFSRWASARDGRQNRCRSCFREQYAANRADLLSKIQIRHARIREEKEGRLAAYLAEHPCVNCGVRDLRVLDFDHRDPELKQAGIGVMLGGGWTWAAVLVEIAKCDVRCANCHRIRTAGQQDWWKEHRQLDLQADSELQSRTRLRSLFPHADLDGAD